MVSTRLRSTIRAIEAIGLLTLIAFGGAALIGPTSIKPWAAVMTALVAVAVALLVVADWYLGRLSNRTDN